MCIRLRLPQFVIGSAALFSLRDSFDVSLIWDLNMVVDLNNLSSLLVDNSRCYQNFVHNYFFRSILHL